MENEKIDDKLNEKGRMKKEDQTETKTKPKKEENRKLNGWEKLAKTKEHIENENIRNDRWNENEED